MQMKQIESDDFTSDHLMGIVLTIKKKHLFDGDFEFVLDITMTGEILCADGEYRYATLKYPIEITIKQQKLSDQLEDDRRRAGSRNRRTIIVPRYRHRALNNGRVKRSSTKF